MDNNNRLLDTLVAQAPIGWPRTGWEFSDCDDEYYMYSNDTRPDLSIKFCVDRLEIKYVTYVGPDTDGIWEIQDSQTVKCVLIVLYPNLIISRQNNKTVYSVDAGKTFKIPQHPVRIFAETSVDPPKKTIWWLTLDDGITWNQAAWKSPENEKQTP